MIIKSAFKDYYDFVANQYGGGDPNVVYVRQRLTPLKKYDGAPCNDTLEVPVEDCKLKGFYRWYRGVNDHQPSYMYLVICGKCYLISHPSEFGVDNVNEYTLQPVEQPEEDKKKHKYFYRHDTWEHRFGVKFGVEYPFLIELSRKLQAPAFAIKDIRYDTKQKAQAVIAGQCPILQEIGLPSLISPYIMYQDISYFVGNTMKAVPDTEPPVELSNRQKIVKAGFDLVQSFRHRK